MTHQAIGRRRRRFHNRTQHPEDEKNRAVFDCVLKELMAQSKKEIFMVSAAEDTSIVWGDQGLESVIQ